MTQILTQSAVDGLRQRVDSQRLTIEQLESRCSMMQRIAQQYMEERQRIYCHLQEMGLQLNHDNTISKKG